ncbi:MAG: pirin family protein, partial [Dokdonella sp.]
RTGRSGVRRASGDEYEVGNSLEHHRGRTMISRWPAVARGCTDEDGLRLHHGFSSRRYHDPRRMGFGALRVLDSGYLTAAAGMPMERRANMEILTLLTAGDAIMQAADQRHAMGSGDLFWLGAGNGIAQSLVPTSNKPCSFIQLWLQPMRVNAEPRFALRRYREVECRQGCWLVASGRADAIGEEVLPMRADADVHIARLARSESLRYDIQAERRVWIQVLRGAVAVDGDVAETGDGLAVTDRRNVTIDAGDDSELLLIELA